MGTLRQRAGGDDEIDPAVEGLMAEVVDRVKLSATAQDHDVRHLRWLRDQHPDVVDCVVLTTGTTAYRRRDGIAVVPLALLGD